MQVLVTRPEAQGRRTAARLRALGHEPLVAPLLEIRPTGTTPPPGAFRAAIVTSVNAVPALAAWLRRAPGPGHGPVFAVGERTAERARMAGLESVEDCAGQGGDAAALVRRIRCAVPAGSALLLAAGRDRKAEPAGSLLAHGYDVAVWEVYEAVMEAEIPPLLASALRTGSLEAALHYSRRSAETAVRLVAGAGLSEPFRALLHHALSADVAEPLRAAGAGRVKVAARPDEAALLQGLGPAHSPSGAPGC